jgi:hypothetical protein
MRAVRLSVLALFWALLGTACTSNESTTYETADPVTAPLTLELRLDSQVLATEKGVAVVGEHVIALKPAAGDAIKKTFKVGKDQKKANLDLATVPPGTYTWTWTLPGSTTHFLTRQLTIGR